MKSPVELHGWGRYPRCRTALTDAADPLAASRFHREMTGFIARGNGRAYGDAAIGACATLSARRLNRMLAFDPQSGLLTVEAGVLLADILKVLVPRGYFPKVVPGTKFVTVGGMVAADVHGKNHHHDGGFGDNLQSLKLVLPDGETVTCSRSEHASLFAATIGGMGLTGTIVEASFQLRPVETAWMQSRTIAAPDLASAMVALQKSADATYSVAWIDCLARGAATGRSLILLAEHATLDDIAAVSPPPQPPIRHHMAVPFELPSWTLNRMTVAAFNELYFQRGAAQSDRPFLAHWDPYFFPLDGIADWNRLYGHRGLLQHQCVIPAPHAYQALGEMLERISRCGRASPLAVLKQLRASRDVMSFPIEGFTLAIDFPVAREVLSLLDEIDRIVVRAGGRLYLAKDARQSRETFEAGYPRFSEFREIRRNIGAEGKLSSQLAKRLGI
jgi:FAD/FMN-containing dehydrogenase